jgi:hypothetical protein
MVAPIAVSEPASMVKRGEARLVVGHASHGGDPRASRARQVSVASAVVTGP